MIVRDPASSYEESSAPQFADIQTRIFTPTCMFCGCNNGQNISTAAQLANLKSRTSDVSMIVVLKKITGAKSFGQEEGVCNTCYDDLHKHDEITSKCKQMQQQMVQRYRSKKREDWHNVQKQISSNIKTLNRSLASVKKLPHNTPVDVTSNLSVTYVNEPLPKKRRYGIPEDEYFNSKRKHSCEYTCNNMSFSSQKQTCLAAVTQHPADERNIGQQRIDITRHDSSLSHRQMRPKSIRCSVGDLDKSHISALFNTPSKSNYRSSVEGARLSTPSGFPNSLHRNVFNTDNFNQERNSILSLENRRNYLPNIRQPQLYNPNNKLRNSRNLNSNNELSCVAIGSNNFVHFAEANKKVNNTVCLLKNNQEIINPISNGVVNDNEKLVSCLNETDSSDEEGSSLDADQSNKPRLNTIQNQKQRPALVIEENATINAAALATAAAQAMFLSNPATSSLLQSFLTTSMWWHGGATAPGDTDILQQKDDHCNDGDDSDDGPHEELSEDVTSETLAVGANAQDKNTRNELKNTGQSYVNTKGKMVDAKRVSPQDCSKCVLRCNNKLSEVDRQSVFAEYWGLADYGKQREFLAGHMHREEKLGPSGLTRTVVLYYLTHHKKVQVCRQFFLKTLDVSEKASRIVLEKKGKGDFGAIGAPPPAPTHRTTSSRSRRMVANNQDSDYEY